MSDIRWEDVETAVNDGFKSLCSLLSVETFLHVASHTVCMFHRVPAGPDLHRCRHPLFGLGSGLAGGSPNAALHLIAFPAQCLVELAARLLSIWS